MLRTQLKRLNEQIDSHDPIEENESLAEAALCFIAGLVFLAELTIIVLLLEP